jgi:hypothetical protein
VPVDESPSFLPPGVSASGSGGNFSLPSTANVTLPGGAEIPPVVEVPVVETPVVEIPVATIIV